MSLNQWKPKNIYHPLCLRETIKLLQPLDCLLPPIVSDSKEKDGLKNENLVLSNELIKVELPP